MLFRSLFDAPKEQKSGFAQFEGIGAVLDGLPDFTAVPVNHSVDTIRRDGVEVDVDVEGDARMAGNGQVTAVEVDVKTQS